MADRKVKIGVVGCGVVASAYYLPFLMDHEPADLVAVCDLTEQRAKDCARLFGAKEIYTDYHDMLAKADIEAVWILTGPGTHKAFAVAAAEAGKHILLQKPMATTKADADAIQAVVKKAGVHCLVEPSQQSPLQPPYPRLRELVKQGALGDPYWFSFIWTGPDHDNGGLGHNPYGAAAFLTKESGGMLYDYAYGPSQIVSVLGTCKSVMAMAALQVPDRPIVPESDYTNYLSKATDPWDANYWDAVVKAPKTDSARTEAPDVYNILYEMEEGWIGMFHVGRPFQPIPKGVRGGSMEVFGTEGNIYFDPYPGIHSTVSSTNRSLLNNPDENGWETHPKDGDLSKAKWPKPVPGGFNYYHESSRELIDCILTGRRTMIDEDWGAHINEMLTGAQESAETGRKYEMQTRVNW
ncbi:Gfo/Idh/MocA family protein [Oceanomicrobium pacificus]|uniref:Gfo/Idh/MocA family oxidoreductase n=1 Tax=Oceanomicrobium pacificus TaxID=2692916 RepID=A0A6B0TT41_9RHOB|nr:Gfo/Idh/MocA family oxidoreductase [Oceanomicrobium pacificus]MXU64392.1 Gfo/Idh/MocA family oxidoreductase [Oceanomicrobium pacificus]